MRALMLSTYHKIVRKTLYANCRSVCMCSTKISQSKLVQYWNVPGIYLSSFGERTHSNSFFYSICYPCHPENTFTDERMSFSLYHRFRSQLNFERACKNHETLGISGVLSHTHTPRDCQNRYINISETFTTVCNTRWNVCAKIESKLFRMLTRFNDNDRHLRISNFHCQQTHIHRHTLWTENRHAGFYSFDWHSALVDFEQFSFRSIAHNQTQNRFYERSIFRLTRKQSHF